MTPLAAHIQDVANLSEKIAPLFAAAGKDVAFFPVRDCLYHLAVSRVAEQMETADEENRKLARLSDEIGGK